MTHPLGFPAALVLVMLLPAALASAQDAPRKAPDVMTVNGAQVRVTAPVPDLTAPPRAGAGRAAPRVFASRAEYEAALVEALARGALRGARKLDAAAAKPPGARPAAGSIPALLGPLPRPEWGAGLAPPEPKPADDVTIGEPTGIETPPATNAPVAAPAPRANAAPKAVRDLSTTAPRDATAPPPSPAKPEVKR